MGNILSFLTPPKAREEKEASVVDKQYGLMRLQVFIGIFIGYAGYYLVRKNLTLAMTDLTNDYGFSKEGLGTALAMNGIAYGLAKFIMGGISDRSDARKFLALGLILASGVTMVAGSSIGLTSVYSIGLLQFLIGWFGGMGWPPCGRVMTHWFSTNERGTKMSIWNLAHNVGGIIMPIITIFGASIAIQVGFQNHPWVFGTFILPAIIAILLAVISYMLIRDNPQSQGLPSIEKYRDDYPADYSEKSEEVLSTKDIFFNYVLNNRVLWFVALSNAFVYFLRYGVQDWLSSYLQEFKGFTKTDATLVYTYFEMAAIPGTLICGVVSDYLFKGKRAMTIIIFMILVLLGLITYWKSTDPLMITIGAVAVGFFVYGPVMLIGVQALDLSPKNAAGTSAGFTGFFGYFIGTSLLSNLLLGQFAGTAEGWENYGFPLLIIGGIISIILMAMTIPSENKRFKLKK